MVTEREGSPVCLAIVVVVVVAIIMECWRSNGLFISFVDSLLCRSFRNCVVENANTSKSVLICSSRSNEFSFVVGGRNRNSSNVRTCAVCTGQLANSPFGVRWQKKGQSTIRGTRTPSGKGHIVFRLLAFLLATSRIIRKWILYDSAWNGCKSSPTWQPFKAMSFCAFVYVLPLQGMQHSESSSRKRPTPPSQWTILTVRNDLES